MTEGPETQVRKSGGIDLKHLLILKLAGILGAVLLLILQVVLTGETISIEKHTSALVSIEDKIAREIGDVYELLEKRK